MDDIDRVYEFWFGDAPARDAAAAEAKMRRWYMGGPALDDEVREKFATLVERAVVDAAGDFEVAAATLGLSSSYLRRLVRSLNVKLP